MSGIVKAVKKVFKKVAKAVKKVAKAVVKIAKPVLIAAAVYFTAGAAIGAFGGAGLISSMPGWGTTGIFTKAATAIGVPGFGGTTSLLGGTSAAAGAATTSGVTAGTTSGLTGTATLTGGAPVASEVAAAGASKGIVGSIASGAKAVGGYMAKNPMATYVVGQGISQGMASREADKERKRQEQKDRERGFFGMDQVGNQIDLPTSPGYISSITAPTVQGQQTQTEQAQQGGVIQAPGQPQIAQLTPSQLLELQRQSYIKNPYGTY